MQVHCGVKYLYVSKRRNRSTITIEKKKKRVRTNSLRHGVGACLAVPSSSCSVNYRGRINVSFEGVIHSS